MEYPKDYDTVVNEVKKRFTVSDFYVTVDSLGSRYTFEIVPTYDLHEKFRELFKEMRKIGKIPLLKREEEGLQLKIIPFKGPNVSLIKDLLITLGSFLATLITIGWAGLLLGGGDILTAIMFLISMISIIALHETGHFIAGKLLGANISTPIFFPGIPTIGGTFGAVIRMREPPIDRRQMLIMGISGPIMGFIIALIVSYIGLHLSTITFEQPKNAIFLPSPPILSILASLIYGDLEGKYLIFHPVAFAGWVGMLVTFLNLTPAGQLDGGHIFRAILGPRYSKIVSYIAILILVITGWYLMAILALFFLNNPGPLNDLPEDKKLYYTIPAIAVLLWLLTMVIIIQ